MLLIERRNRRNVQIFFLLITFLLISGLFFWFFRYSEQEIDYLPEEVHVNQKNEREMALEKVRRLQAGLNDVAGDTVYDDPSKNTVSENRDNFENANNLFQRVNATAIKEAVLQNLATNGKMTADSFYDEKLKQKEEEDRIADRDQEDPVDEDVIPASDQFRKNNTISHDLVGKSAAVQSWLAKQEGVRKPLSEFESSLKMEEVEVASRRRNPKFEGLDADTVKRNNRVHQFKFVQ